VHSKTVTKIKVKEDRSVALRSNSYDTEQTQEKMCTQ
jgi:hypothetical protein